MTPVEPEAFHEDAHRVIFGVDQPQYLPLPAMVRDSDGLVLTEWELSAEDLARLLDGGRLRVWLHTFGMPLQPIAVEVAGSGCAMRES